MTRIEAVPLKPFGVELHVDLREELSIEAVEELRRLYAGHDLLVVRDQHLTMEQQTRAVAHLGPVRRRGNGLVAGDRSIGRGAERCFHSDRGHTSEPLHALSLHAIDVVDGETSTRFASGRRAYDEAGRELRSRLEGLSALQVFGTRPDTRNRLADLDPRLPSTPHPVVQPHFGTGGAFLFAPEMTTDSIVGLPERESEAIIAEVFDLLYDDTNVLEHIWCIGDLVIWNNVAVVHAHADHSWADRLVLQRVTLGTTASVDLFPGRPRVDGRAGGARVARTLERR